MTKPGPVQYLIAVLALALLMVVHEAGHFLAARAFGMRVTRFSIGFGPTLFKILPKDGYFWLTVAADRFKIRLGKHDPARHGPTIYQVAIIPFLAYVQIAGMNPLEDVDKDDDGSYANASLIGRIVTIFSGPLANYLFASVFFFLSFFFGGKYEVDGTAVNVVPDHPAAAAHMNTGDRVVEVAGTKVSNWDEMAAAISARPGQTIPIVVERQGERVTLTVTPANESGKGKIGVGIVQKHVDLDSRSAAVLALTEPPRVVKDTVVGIGQWITGKAKGEFVGPLGIAGEIAKAAALGFAQVMGIIGAISAYLGAFNLLPFPALDGGRLVFLAYEATTRRRANAWLEQNIHLVGILVLIGVMLVVTYHELLPGPK
jgi:regulator of sigma E protease